MLFHSRVLVCTTGAVLLAFEWFPPHPHTTSNERFKLHTHTPLALHY